LVHQRQRKVVGRITRQLAGARARIDADRAENQGAQRRYESQTDPAAVRRRFVAMATFDAAAAPRARHGFALRRMDRDRLMQRLHGVTKA
jgi:hypothetical protein